MDYKYAKAILSTTFLAFLASDVYAQYRYPEVRDPSRTPLYFGLMQSFGGDYDGSGVIPGIDVALDQINNDPTLLPGYTLHYTLSDSQCDRNIALETFSQEISSEPTKIAWLGSGCSVATEPTAEISQNYNITQLSCQSSSSILRDRNRFGYYFQFLLTDDNLADGYFGIIKTFGWRHVAIIVQNENLFTSTMGRLKSLLDQDGITYTESLFASADGVGSQLFDPDARIFILSMYQGQAEELLCEAYEQGLRYPTHIFLPLTWFQLDDPGGRCPLEQRRSVLPYVLGPLQVEWLTDNSVVADNGVSGEEFEEAYSRRLNETPLDLTPNIYRSGCYDMTWALAYALNNTITDLQNNATLRMQAANEIPDDEADIDFNDFRIENFTYANRAIVDTMFRHLEETNFNGLVAPLSFDDQGIRQSGLQEVLQYRPLEDGSLELVTVGRIEGSGVNARMVYVNGFTEETVMPDGVVSTGGALKNEVSAALPLSVIISLLVIARINHFL